jgi:uncharacterized protein involved in exopolysaccharide biosynthesis
MTITTRNDLSAISEDRGPAAHAAGRSPPPLRGVLGVMWDYRLFISVVTLVSTVIATVVTFSVDDKYLATITISPVSDDASSGRLGGLASLASEIGGAGSIGISSPGNTQKQESLATLQSEALTERYISENNLLPILYDSKWDPVKRTWKDLPPAEIPTLWKANQYFKRHVRGLTSDVKSGLATMTIAWKDPKQAAQWANGLVQLTNNYLRAKAIDESERNIQYLKEQLSKTSIIGVQSAINSILESEMKKAMIAQGSREYAIKVIDPAFAPEKRISPLPALWIPMGFFLGLLVSTVAAYVFRFRPIRLYVHQYVPKR